MKKYIILSALLIAFAPAALRAMEAENIDEAIAMEQDQEDQAPLPVCPDVQRAHNEYKRRRALEVPTVNSVKSLAELCQEMLARTARNTTSPERVATAISSTLPDELFSPVAKRIRNHPKASPFAQSTPGSKAAKRAEHLLKGLKLRRRIDFTVETSAIDETCKPSSHQFRKDDRDDNNDRNDNLA